MRSVRLIDWLPVRSVGWPANRLAECERTEFVSFLSRECLYTQSLAGGVLGRSWSISIGIPMGFDLGISHRARPQSVWLPFGLMYMMIESDDVQTNREHELVCKPSRDFQNYLTEIQSKRFHKVIVFNTSYNTTLAYRLIMA